jgi:hypothetical protein
MATDQQTPSAEAKDRLPSGIPNVYADGVSDVIYGINTCKLVFSVETGLETPMRPQITVTIPTPALVSMALTALRDLASEPSIAETRTRQASYLALLRAIQMAQVVEEVEKAGRSDASPRG